MSAADKTISERATENAHALIKGRSFEWTRDGAHHQVSIAFIFSYGAVDIDPKYLVVWVIVKGPSENLVPEWYQSNKSTDDLTESPRIDASLFTFFEKIKSEILAVFKAEAWNHSDPLINFESDRRVAEGGGWHYFK